MKVLKFGGTSVGSAESIRSVGEIVSKSSQEASLVVVVSAMSGVTDLLLNAGKNAANQMENYLPTLLAIENKHLEVIRLLFPIQYQSGVLSTIKNNINQIEEICKGIAVLGEFSNRTSDRLVSYGEQMSAYIISQYFSVLGLHSNYENASLLIKTDQNFTQANVDFELTNTLIRNWHKSFLFNIAIVPGFVGTAVQGEWTTLGRGGSDYTAAIFSAALNAEQLEIWTDVNGMLTADPRYVTHAKTISNISYQEAMELSHFGAKVIYPPTIQPVMKIQIPVWIKNTFEPDNLGTLITHESQHESREVSGLSSLNNLALISLEGSGMVGIPGFSKRLFETLAKEKINVVLITQSSSEHAISVAIDNKFVDKAIQSVHETFEQEIQRGIIDPLIVEDSIAIVALVGDQMRQHPGIAGKMFSALGRNGINIRAIAQGSSERNISVIIATENVKKALNVLHEEFFEKTIKNIHLYIAGTGNVGRKLLNQIQKQQQFLLENHRIQLHIMGIINSRNMHFWDDKIGFDENWQEKGENADIHQFTKMIIQKNLRNAVFIDVTASDKVAEIYPHLLAKSVAVVACNKTAASSQFFHYQQLRQMSVDYHVPFLYETNVGAALPIIGTLNDIIKSGDRIHKISAVLSGTLNFVFNHYDATKTFSSIVKKAQLEGYTEPDPRLDLSGTDVARKLLILAREAGRNIEMTDIHIQGFLPENCLTGSVDDFYHSLKSEESTFQKLYLDAIENGKKLRYIAHLEIDHHTNKCKAWTGLEQINDQHDFFHLYGKDNAILFYTDRYADYPLVIKGAGAGAEVTASGVFADILRTIKSSN